MRQVYITLTPRPTTTCRSVNLNESGLTERDAERFWSKVERRSPDACWLWTASLLGGRRGHREYGQFVVKHPDGTPRKVASRYAHRVSWEMAYGPVPAGVQVCHRCDVPRCVNPAHLFLGTHLDNMRDASAKGRLAGVARPNARKVSDAQLVEIFALAASGVKQVHIAQQFGVTESCVSLLLGRKRRQPASLRRSA